MAKRRPSRAARKNFKFDLNVRGTSLVGISYQIQSSGHGSVQPSDGSGIDWLAILKPFAHGLKAAIAWLWKKITTPNNCTLYSISELSHIVRELWQKRSEPNFSWNQNHRTLVQEAGGL